MRPRLRKQGYLAVLAKHSAGRRPAVSSARVWRGSSVLAACAVVPDGSKSRSTELCRPLKAQIGFGKTGRQMLNGLSQRG